MCVKTEKGKKGSVGNNGSALVSQSSGHNLPSSEKWYAAHCPVWSGGTIPPAESSTAWPWLFLHTMTISGVTCNLDWPFTLSSLPLPTTGCVAAH
jgi:hypothetical protein